MFKKILLSSFGALILLISQSANALSIDLFEYAVNVDGGITGEYGYPVCTDLGLDSDCLGTLSFDISGAGDHFIDLFVDYEIDETVNTYFNEYGSTGGTPAAGQSWEIDDPVFGWIYGDFASSDLWNENYAAQGGCTTGDLDDVDAGECFDVSMALGWDFTLGAGETAAVDFTIGSAVPTSGFYLIHTDPLSQYSLYFSSTLDITGDEQPVPEPGTLWLLGAGLIALGMSRRKLNRI